MKIRIKFLVFCLSFFACDGYALPAAVVLNDSNGYYDLTASCEHFKFSQKSLNIRDIQKNFKESDWEKTQKGKLNIPMFSEAEWYRFKLISHSVSTWYLDFDNPLSDSIDVYIFAGGEVQEIHLGDRYPAVFKPINTGSFFTPLNLLPGIEFTVFIRVVAKDLTRFPIAIYSLEAKANSQSNKNLLYGIFFGWIGLMLLYNFFVFLTTKEKAYLYYCLYSFGIGMLIATLEGYSFHYFWPENIWLQEIMPPLLSGIGGIGSLLFVKYFLNTKQNAPIVNLILTLLIAWDLISFLVLFIGNTSTANLMVQGSAVLGSITIILAAIIVLRTKYRPALFFAQGYLIANCGVIVYICANFGVLPTNNWVIAAIPFSTSIEIALLSMALADRLSFTLKQEAKARLIAQRAMEKANRELEQKISERTYQISRQNQILGIHRKALEQQKSEIENERQKSDNLLLNVLPKDVADELKENGKTKARFFSDVSVLFTDIVNFTQISEKLGPKKLVEELDYYFCEFDKIVERNGLEKIKTIGDAYLAVAGIGDSNEKHATCAINAAIELVDFVKKITELGENHFFQIRAGIHSGPIVAGVVGANKFAFDIWGDTVNTAARMEQNGKQGRVNVSGQTHLRTQNEFVFEHRGKVLAKNKGELDMYFVTHIEKNS